MIWIPSSIYNDLFKMISRNKAAEFVCISDNVGSIHDHERVDHLYTKKDNNK